MGCRVLIVDDNESWRGFLTETVTHKAKMVVVGEALDGFEAVQLAQDLQPDLILLDIGLPTLNGIEAARLIARVSPRSKVIFVTQESNREVCHAALNTGACGFVLKSHAASDLLRAIQVVLAGDRFATAMPGLVSI